MDTLHNENTETYTEILEAVRGLSVGAAHGYDHILAVFSNAKNMIRSSPVPLNEKQKHIVLLAAILHDVDDHKFNSAADSENLTFARELLLKYFPEIAADLVLFCISLVSYSKNKHTFPTVLPSEIVEISCVPGMEICAHVPPLENIAVTVNMPMFPDYQWILIPRHADRIEAIDWGRAAEYGASKGRERYNERTRRYFYVESIHAAIRNGIFRDMEKEYIARNCRAHPDADTTMDHIYEKCMNLVVETGNPWCDMEMKKRQDQLNCEIVEFWRKNDPEGFKWYPRYLIEKTKKIAEENEYLIAELKVLEDEHEKYKRELEELLGMKPLPSQ